MLTDQGGAGCIVGWLWTDGQEAGAFTQQITECLDKLDSSRWRPTIPTIESMPSLILSQELRAGKEAKRAGQGEARR